MHYKANFLRILTQFIVYLVIDQYLKMVAKRRRKKTQLRLLNVILFSWSLVPYLGRQYMKQGVFLCMHIWSPVWPNIWLG